MNDRLRSTRIGILLSLAVGLLFLGAGAAAIALVDSQQRQQALAEAESKARLLLDHNLAIHHFYSHELKPKLFALTDAYRSEEYFEPAWMSSTYAIRQIDGEFRTLNPNDYYYKECAVNARSPANEADDFERAFLRELNSSPGLVQRSEIRSIGGVPYFVVLRRGEEMEESCLRCHSTPDRAPQGLVALYGPERGFGRGVGEAVHAISIRVPLAAAYAQADLLSAQLSTALIGLLACLFALQLWLYRRYLIAPLSLVQEKALRVIADPQHLGEQIPPSVGKELNDLIGAFNTMSGALRESWDRLEERVKERTAQWQESNEQLRQSLAERQALQKQLLRAHRLETAVRIAARISDDFNNLLGPLVAYPGVINRLLPSGHPASRYCEAMQEAAEQMVEISHDMATLGSRGILQEEAVQINELARQVVAERASRLPGVSIELDLDMELPPISGSRQGLHRLVSILVSNAQEAMGELGQMILRTEQVEIKISEGRAGRIPAGAYVRLTVDDSGPGIPEAIRERVFEPFFTTRPPSAGKRRPGLGLSIAAAVVEDHRGYLEVASQEGSGTSMIVYLPTNRGADSSPGSGHGVVDATDSGGQRDDGGGA